MFQMGKRAKQYKRAQELKSGGVVIPSVRSDFPTDYLALSLKDLPGLAANYVAAMETEASEKWCRCEWIIHPDDIDVKPGHCRLCGEKAGASLHSHPSDPDFKHSYRGMRKRRGEHDGTCPVHTKEGFLVYFHQWVMDNAK